MANPKHPHSEIIARLGGATRVAAHLELNVVNTVGKWPWRGVPAEYWTDLVNWAAEDGIAGVTHDAFRAGRKAARNARAVQPDNAVAAT
jgi:hypothetical protein